MTQHQAPAGGWHHWNAMDAIFHPELIDPEECDPEMEIDPFADAEDEAEMRERERQEEREIFAFLFG